MGIPRVVASLATAAATVGLVAQVASAAPGPTQRVDLKVLLVSSDGTEPSYLAWKQQLQSEGVPFDDHVISTAPRITAAALATGTTSGRYQAIVFATDLVPLALNATERAAISSYEVAYGVRQVDAYVYPSPEEGLNYPTAAGGMGTLGLAAALTPAGKTAFPYLVGPVSYEATDYGFLATPLTLAAPAKFDTLVTGPNGSSTVGVYTRPDRVLELVNTVSVGPSTLSGQLFLRGMIAWATEGVHLGLWRNNLSLHVDDIFLPDDRWDTVNHVTHEDDGATLPLVEMTPADVTRAVTWQRSSGIKLDMVFNGTGRDDQLADTGTDPLGNALLANRSSFRWINHTYSHLNLDAPVTAPDIVAEITANTAFAARNGLAIDRRELVTGEHSGLSNPAMAQALTTAGISWTASDNSRQPEPYTIGSATTVPRFPMNIYYNVGTQAEQLNEYNWIYMPPPAGACVNSATNTCRTTPATWADYVASETTIMMRHILGNDPRPHYVHQSNLAEEGTLYPVIDSVLARYKGWFNVPLDQPTLQQTSVTLAQKKAWNAAVAAGQITAYRYGPRVFLISSAPTNVLAPATGPATGYIYGGRRSQWLTLTPNRAISFIIT